MASNNSRNYFKIGFLFFVALTLLGTASVFIGNLEWLFGDSYLIRISFKNVGGLKEGDPCRVSGLEMGRVEKLELKPRDVLVTVRMTEPVDLHEDYTVQVAMSSLVGGRHVAINPGDPDRPTIEKEKVTLEGKLAGTGIEEFGKMVEENRRSVREFLDNLNQISVGIKEGKGTIGKLLSDEQLYDEAKAALAEVKASIGEMKKAGELIAKINAQFESGEGTLVKLLKSNEIYDDLKASTEQIKLLLADAQEGKGTLGKMLKDEQLYDDARALMVEMKDAVASVRRITEKIESGEGTAARILNDREMADQVAETVAEVKELSTSLKNIAQKIERGEGTIGKLVVEDALYKKAEESLTSLDNTLGKASRVKTYVSIAPRYYKESEQMEYRGAIRIYPKPDRFFHVGGVAWPLAKDARYDFKEKFKEDDPRGDLFLKPDVLLGWLFLDNRLTIKGGLIEGKIGGGLDYRLTVPGINHDVTFSAEVRDAWDDVRDLDEHGSGAMIRAYASTRVWKWFHVHAGVSRIGHDPEFFAGFSFEYEDEDIRTFISLMGLAN